MPAAPETATGIVLPSPLSGGRLLTALATYFLLHLLLRVLVSGSLELDEAEQVVLTQSLEWGYGSQPPLYTWMQSALFALFGEGVFTLALLKNLLLFGVYLFTYLAAREMAGEETTAVAATVSLLLIPQIAWESQRDLTHSVLATVMAAATLYAFTRLCRRQRTGDYLLLGLCAGLGILGKYNFAVFLTALFLASLSLPPFRGALLERRILLTLSLLLLITGGHIAWVFSHMADTLRQAGTFQRQGLQSLWLDFLHGTGSLLLASAAFLGPLLAVYLTLFFRPHKEKEPSTTPFRFLLGRLLLIGVLVCLVLVAGFQVTNFKDRWMQPLLFATAIYLPLRFRPQLTAKRLRHLLAITAAVAVLVLILLPSRTLLASRISGSNQLNAPFAPLAEGLRQAGFQGGHIVASSRWLGGNLRLQFPAATVLVPELPPAPYPPEGPWLVVWDATRHPEMPPRLHRFCEELQGCRSEGSPRWVEAPSHFGDGTRRLGFLLVPEEGGEIGLSASDRIK